MFSFFNKKNIPLESNIAVMDFPVTKQYSKEVQLIHNEFFTASDKLIEEANRIINTNREKVNIEKVDRLKKLGFNKVKEVVETTEKVRNILLSEKQLERLNFYKQKYPFFKFITVDQVTEICKKYNLLCGNVTDYTGFVPEKNLKQIENFLSLHTTENILICRLTKTSGLGEAGTFFYIENAEVRGDGHGYFHIFKKGDPTSKYSFQSDAARANEFYSNDHKNLFNLGMYGDLRFSIENNDLKICAPVKDFDMTNKRVNSNLTITDIPDPIVLKPVQHGYLIVTAWGDEASDPLVVNEINN